MDVLTPLAVWLNIGMNALGRWLLAPIGAFPAWLTVTVISVVAGVLLLVVFKYTSHQRAIKWVRDDITANLLALKLFKDSAGVAVQAQGRLLRGAVLLLLLGLVPTLVMMGPVILLLVQLDLWYEHRPLKAEEEAIVTMKLGGDADSPLPDVSLQPPAGVETTVGPVRIPSKREICWKIKASKPGYQRLVFQVGEQTFDKELAVGDGYMRVSTERPGWHPIDILLHPSEPPFRPDSAVQSIEIEYPQRTSLRTGSESWMTSWFVALVWAADWVGKTIGWPAWMIYFFVVSLAAGFAFRRMLKVNV